MTQAKIHFTCPHTHLLHSGRCGCCYQTKNCVAEKEFSACVSQSASKDCIALYRSIKAQSNFALNSHSQIELSIGQQNKIKMGGMLALQKILFNNNSDTISDIHKLNQQIKAKYRGFDNLPFSNLMQSIASFKFRQKRR